MRNRLSSRLADFIGIATFITLGCFGCAHTNESETESSRDTKFKYEHTETFNFPAAAPFALIYQLGSIPVGSSVPKLWGECQVLEHDDSGQRLGEPYPCPETFLELKDTKNSSTSKVWMNDRGEFEVPMQKAELYQIKAVCERYMLTSNEVQISRPGKISLTIHRKKRNLKD